MKLSALLGAYLHQRGIDAIYGILGREAAQVRFNESKHTEFVLTRHEFAAGMIAATIAHYTKKPQVCFATLGPGSTNLITALASARQDKLPLIAIVAQAETRERSYNILHQCVDIVALAKPVTKYAREIETPGELIPALDAAFKVAMQAPVGPALISIPIDLFEQEVAQEFRVSTSPEIGFFDIQTADRIARALSGAKHPLIIAGDGITKMHSPDLITQFVEATNIPLVNSISGHGALPATHPLFFGTVTQHIDRILSMPALDTLFGGVDTIVLLGYDIVDNMFPRIWMRGREKRVIALNEFHSPSSDIIRPDIELLGSLDEALRYLSPRVARHVAPTRPEAIDRVKRAALADESTHDEGLLVSQIINALNARFRNDYILASDVGLHRYNSSLFFPARRPGDYVSSAGFSSFGTGLPLGIGAAIANPKRHVVVMAGDSGFVASSAELETVARLNLPLTIIVCANGTSALIERFQKMKGGDANPAVTRSHDIDFTQLARAYGIEGVRADSPMSLRVALGDARASTSPLLIEVPVRYPSLYWPDEERTTGPSKP